MRTAHLTTRPLRMAHVLLVLLSLAFGLLIAPSPRAEAAGPPTVTAQAAPSAAAASRSTVMKCANAAKKKAKKYKKYKYWVCLGPKAKFLKRNKAPSPLVADKSTTVTGPKRLVRPADIPGDDQRCELVPECTNIRTLYRADIKANALYGYSDEIWGSFDVVYVQAFNGASSRYRLSLIWDYGYEIDSQYWVAQVRRNLTGLPDPVTGVAYFYPDYISSNRWAVIDPSDTGFKSTEPTSHKGRHHDDLYGNFIANGQIFGTTLIHLPDFHCPSSRCKYYGPTGPV